MSGGGRRLAAVMGLAMVALVLPDAPVDAQEEELSVTFAAVRQGDGAVYQGPCGELGVIDTPRFRADDVLAVLDGYGSRDLEWVAATHYHADHIGGLAQVATASGASVERVYDRGGGADAYDSQTYRDYHAWATGAGVDRQPVSIGETFTLCSGTEQVSFEVLSVGRDGTARGDTPVANEDDHSLCLRVEYRGFSHATCGDLSGTDAGDRTDMESVVAPALGSVDVAQINHHGSANSSNPTWVGTLDPAVAVVSTGANPHGHPDPDVLARWRDAGADVYQTQDGDNEPVHGDITVATAGGGGFTVTTSTGASQTYGDPDDGGDGPGDASITQACPPERVPDSGFTDIAGNTHEAAIDCIVWYEVTQGVGGQGYAPAGTVTRDQMASFIARAMGQTTDLPAPSPQGFTDVAGNAHEARILQLAEVGVVQGTTASTYSPRLDVSRAQMATFLARAFEQATGHQLPAPDDHFVDDDASIHEININKAAEAGFTTGTSASSFSPSASVRRDQMASFIARMLNKFVADGHMTADPEPQPDPAPPQREPEPEPEPEPAPEPEPNCDPSYPDVCIPPPPPDLNCDDIEHRDFRVTGDDPHRFDGDNDGRGCET